jgi:signal transduction histidine kinase
MTTSKKLWIGYMILTATLVSFSLAIAALLWDIGKRVDLLADVARPRSVATRQLEINVLDYILGVTDYVHSGEAKFRQAAEDDAMDVALYLREYARSATTKRQHEMAARFAILWRECKELGHQLMDTKNRQPAQEEWGKLRKLKTELETLLDDEMQPDAIQTYNWHRDATQSSIYNSVIIALIQLIVATVIAGIASWAIAKNIAQLRKANEALERSNIELQRFAYVASHDLQSPMRGIAGFVELLRSTYADKLDAQANDWIRRTLESVKHMQTLIRDLLEYSRLDSQAGPLKPVAFRDVFEQATLLLDSLIRETGAKVSCGELPVVMGDRSQLVQLMLNLIGNSLKYRSTDPPCVHISAERKGGKWTFAVRDNGIGIAPKHHKQIFDIFKRLHSQQEYPGTGIGLAVCRRVVHNLGGRIWVESNSGRGSVFYFTLRDGTMNTP